MIAVVGVVTAATAPRLSADRTFLEQGYHEELAAAVRYAQRLAVASGCGVELEVSATAYSARPRQEGSECRPRSSTLMAGGRFFAGRAPVGVTASPSATFKFSADGRVELRRDQIIYVGPFAMTVAAGSGEVYAR